MIFLGHFFISFNVFPIFLHQFLQLNSPERISFRPLILQPRSNLFGSKMCGGMGHPFHFSRKRHGPVVIENGVIDLDLQGHLAISTQNSRKWHSTSLLYTDLGQPNGVTRSKLFLSL